MSVISLASPAARLVVRVGGLSSDLCNSCFCLCVVHGTSLIKSLLLLPRARVSDQTGGHSFLEYLLLVGQGAGWVRKWHLPESTDRIGDCDFDGDGRSGLFFSPCRVNSKHDRTYVPRLRCVPR